MDNVAYDVFGVLGNDAFRNTTEATPSGCNAVIFLLVYLGQVSLFLSQTWAKAHFESIGHTKSGFWIALWMAIGTFAVFPLKFVLFMFLPPKNKVPPVFSHFCCLTGSCETCLTRLNCVKPLFQGGVMVFNTIGFACAVLGLGPILASVFIAAGLPIVVIINFVIGESYAAMQWVGVGGIVLCVVGVAYFKINPLIGDEKEQQKAGITSISVGGGGMVCFLFASCIQPFTGRVSSALVPCADPSKSLDGVSVLAVGGFYTIPIVTCVLILLWYFDILEQNWDLSQKCSKLFSFDPLFILNSVGISIGFAANIGGWFTGIEVCGAALSEIFKVVGQGCAMLTFMILNLKPRSLLDASAIVGIGISSLIFSLFKQTS